MTTATAAKTPPAAPTSTVIPITAITVKANIRKTFDEARLKELAASIKDKGLINPVTVRIIPGTPGKFELVAGERRLRAAKLAGLQSIAAVVRTLSDQEALELQTAENIHRTDLTPIEEARGFQLLTQGGKYTIEQLAQLVDKSTAYVYRAVKLLEAPKAALELLEKGEWTPAHLHQILRFAPDRREEVLNTWLKSWEYQNGGHLTAKHLERYIDRQIGCVLEEALFNKAKPYAGQAACTACPYNSGNQGMLFDGAEKGICSDTGCFEKKTEQHWADQVAALQKRFPEAKVKLIPGYLSVGSEMDGLRMTENVKKETKLREGGAIYISQSQQTTLTAYPIKKDKTQTSAPQRQAKPDPKAEFVKEAVGHEILKALAAKSTKLTKNHLVQLLEFVLDANYTDTERMEKALGFGLEPSKLSETELCQAITIVRLADHPNCMDMGAIKDLGVDVAAVTKKAEAAAKAEWDKTHPAAPAKKGKKA